jgi:hypothetical protein
MPRDKKQTKTNSVDHDVKAPSTETAEATSPADSTVASPASAPEPDSRPPFKPKGEGGSGDTKTAVSFRLDGEGKILDSTRDATWQTAAEAIRKTPGAARKLGLGPRDGSEPTITAKAVQPLFAMLGLAEGAAVAYAAKIPIQHGIAIMMLSDAEMAEVAPLAAEVLEAQAPAWLRAFLLSDNAKIGQLLSVLFRIHQAKLAQIKEYKLQMAEQRAGQPGAAEVAVN